MVIKIEKSVPMPPQNHRGATGAKNFYPFDRMEVGDSFAIPNGFIGPTGRRVTQHSLSSAAYKYGKDHNKQYAIRKVDGGIRVWRVK